MNVCAHAMCVLGFVHVMYALCASLGTNPRKKGGEKGGGLGFFEGGLGRRLVVCVYIKLNKSTYIHRLIEFIRSVSVDDVGIFTCGGCVEPVRMTAEL